MNKKLANFKQIKFVYEIEFSCGKEAGKKALLITNGNIELLISKDNGLDILWLKYCGVNISFLSKNGINNMSAVLKRVLRVVFYTPVA
jgi:hypothetical protein